MVVSVQLKNLDQQKQFQEVDPIDPDFRLNRTLQKLSMHLIHYHIQSRTSNYFARMSGWLSQDIVVFHYPKVL